MTVDPFASLGAGARGRIVIRVRPPKSDTMKALLFTLAFAGLLLARTNGETAPAAPIAADGKALLPLIVSKDASPEIKASADELADYLGRITEAKFEVQTGAGATGLVVGRAQEFPELKTGVSF